MTVRHGRTAPRFSCKGARRSTLLRLEFKEVKGKKGFSAPGALEQTFKSA